MMTLQSMNAERQRNVGKLSLPGLVFAIAMLSTSRSLAAEANLPAAVPTSSPSSTDTSTQSAADPLAVVKLTIEQPVAGKPLALQGPDAQAQLLVTAEMANGSLRDWTRTVTYTVEPAGAVRISADGLAIPLTEGTATITARDESSGVVTTANIEVAGLANHQGISFPSQIVPVFTKLGCNGGGCHGKASGQSGFKLSLLGFEPREDYERVVNEGRGRRVFPAAPDHSLLLTKATGVAPHGGGQRLLVDSHEYRLLHRWIAQGMPYGSGEEPQVISIVVSPAYRQVSPLQSQQIAVVAHLSDGTHQDVTRGAVFESSDRSMAEVTPAGFVSLQSTVGDVAVMARYQGRSAVFRADIPRALDRSAENTIAVPTARNLVDTHVQSKLRALNIPASPRCDDATYLRRVTIDIAGRLPTMEEAIAFAADTAEDRRDSLIERLLGSDDYADYFANKWNAILRNRRTSDKLQYANMALHQWIRESLQTNKPFDDFVRELLTASGTVASNPAVAWYRQVPDTNQRLEDTAQLFLGQRIQCARCHHHPYEKWSQQDYAHMAAFFSLISTKAGDADDEPFYFSRVGLASSPHPKTGQQLPPAGLDASPAPISNEVDPREALVDWMASPENPFFARALVNRYWKHFMGRALVEPEDDLRITNPPSNPELLDGLAKHFIESGYDLKSLVRLICQSETYSRSSDALPENIEDRRSYSRFYPKRMTAEVLLDAVDTVTATTTRFSGVPLGTRAVALPDTGFDSYFLTVFGRPQSTTACECERTQEANLTQSLHLLNSEEIQKKLADEKGRAAQLAADTARSDEEKLKDLYLRVFSRLPSDAELLAAVSYLKAKPNPREAYEDIIWSLVNSKEFLFNH
jgi:hypothetical protein